MRISFRLAETASPTTASSGSSKYGLQILGLRLNVHDQKTVKRCHSGPVAELSDAGNRQSERVMSKTVMGLGAVAVLFGLWMAVLPEHLLSIVDWESRRGLYTAAGMRVVIGLVLLLTASATRYPKGLRIFGALVLLAGLSLPFVPIDFWARMIRWGLMDNLGVLRFVGGVGGILLGVFLVYAASPRPPAASS